MKAYAAAFAALLAASAQGEEMRQLDAHEHGRGALDLAMDGDRLVMSFRAPGADIVGFEHAPRGETQAARIEAALAALRRPLGLFVLPAGAGCTVAEAAARLVAEGDDPADHAHAGDHDGHGGHDGAPAADEGRAHGGDAETSADERGGRHSEFRAEYALVCEAPQRLADIRFDYFERFPSAEALGVTVIDAAGARRFDVTRSAPVLDLPQRRAD